MDLNNLKITHTVFKNDDIVSALSPKQIRQLKQISDDIARHRQTTNRDPNPEYLIVNKDEAYIGAIWNVMNQFGIYPESK